MSNTFLISDTHFSHKGIVQFLRSDGVTKERHWDTIEEMDEALVTNWNSVVRPQDKVYHLGDVVINRSALTILGRLNGTKVLIKGNHDVFRAEEYLKYFKDIRGSGKLDDFLLTHIPIHPNSIGRWKGNWHGHTHSSIVTKEPDECSWPVDGCEHIIQNVPDSRYMCLSVEQINYTPMSLEDAKIRWERQQ